MQLPLLVMNINEGTGSRSGSNHWPPSRLGSAEEDRAGGEEGAAAPPSQAPPWGRWWVESPAKPLAAWPGGPGKGAGPLLVPWSGWGLEQGSPQPALPFRLLWLISSCQREGMSVTANDRVAVLGGTKGQHSRVRGSGRGVGGRVCDCESG